MLRPRRHRGFSLVELMVVVAVLALLMLAAVPALGTWTANARVRGAAEVLQNDLRAAQQEALRRSRRTVLALTAAAPDWNAAPAANGANWYVRAQPLTHSDETASRALSFIVGHQTGGQAGLAVSGPALLCFNAMGQLISVAAGDTGLGVACATGNPVVYTVSQPRADRSFQVRVYLGGRVQMCDAAKLQSNADPDGCPAS